MTEIGGYTLGIIMTILGQLDFGQRVYLADYQTMQILLFGVVTHNLTLENLVLRWAMGNDLVKVHRLFEM